MSMDLDRFQMKDLKRRISKVEDQISYLKTDLKRQTLKIHSLVEQVQANIEELGALGKRK